MVQRALSVDPEVLSCRPNAAALPRGLALTLVSDAFLCAVTAGSGHEEAVSGGLYAHHVRHF